MHWPISPISGNKLCSNNSQGLYSCPAGEWCGSPADGGLTLEEDGVFDNS